MNTCKICSKELESKRAKTCPTKECKNAWKMKRIRNLPEITKLCNICSNEFKTNDKRNNYCSYQCKYKGSAQTMKDRYGYENPMQKPKTDEELIQQEIKELEKKERYKPVRQKYYQNNKYKYKYDPTKYTEERKQYMRDYYQTENGKELALKQRERRRQRSPECDYLNKHELAYIKAYMTYCQKCGKDKDLTLDHHIPVVSGGSLNSKNTVILCKSCNSSKCSKLPEIFYSSAELNNIEKILQKINTKKSIILLAGQSGSGKTWVADQLDNCVSLDQSLNKSMKEIIEKDNPVVTITVAISTFIKRMSKFFDISLVLIDEDLDIIKNRIIKRGGSLTSSLYKRKARIQSLIRNYNPKFVGTSDQVLKYLKSQQNSK